MNWVQYKDLLYCLWLSGRVSVSYTGGPGFQPCNPPFRFLIFLSLNSANSVKTFRENSSEFLFSGEDHSAKILNLAHELHLSVPAVALVSLIMGPHSNLCLFGFRLLNENDHFCF